MRKIAVFVCLLSAALFAQQAARQKAGHKGMHQRMHQASAGTIVTPDKLQWGAPPPVLPPGAQMAVVSGNPNGTGMFVVRLKTPDGYKIMPHWHPTAENVTVLSGEFLVAMGDKWDDAKMQTLPQHSFVSVPAHHNHYAMTKGETEVQITGMGPFKLTYVNPSDDPSKKK